MLRSNHDLSPVDVLVVSPSATVRRVLRDRLSSERWAVRDAHSGSAALDELIRRESDVLLLDTLLPDLHPAEFTGLVRDQFPAVQVLTIDSQTGQTIMALSTPNPVSSELMEVLKLSASLPTPSSRMPSFSNLPSLVRPNAGFRDIVGQSAPMQRVYAAAYMVARRETHVLLTGESGTGKDLFARAIHLASARHKQPFVVVNCAAIPEALLESELFGHTKGAFTGAVQARQGRIHSADGGTLFLDEIGDMPLPLQSKILRFLEQGELQRIGGSDTLRVNVRVLSATNADLKKLSREKLFREDLYYRLAVFPIHLPPLRDRMEDVDELIESLLQKFAPGAVLCPDARELLHQHTWPGNVRELRNVIERASIYAGLETELRAEHIVL